MRRCVQCRRCECCDHPLQHAIRMALEAYREAVPPLTVATVMANLKFDLEQWEADN